MTRTDCLIDSASATSLELRGRQLLWQLQSGGRIRWPLPADARTRHILTLCRQWVRQAAPYINTPAPSTSGPTATAALTSIYDLLSRLTQSPA